MSQNFLELASNLAPKSHLNQAINATKNQEKLFSQLLQHRRIPEIGWSDHAIEQFLLRISAMDSNNYISNCGLGEREARFASNLVARRHFRFGHGIGRSGDLMEAQPKAVGSTLLYNLTNCLLKDLISDLGIKNTECIIIPVATGMALTLVMLSWKSNSNKKYVIWSRIDQKSCFKSILTAGFVPIIVDTVKQEDQLITNLELIKEKIEELRPENILCVMSTTSCFAPRACDNIEEIAKLCKKYDVYHLINNAYGLQSETLVKKIQSAYNKGRVDIFVQSTDKNLLVPVGGSIVCSFNKEILKNVAKVYPGRASSTSVIDVFITLLSLGKSGYKALVEERKAMFEYLKQQLLPLVDLYKERILETPDNPISIGISLNHFPKEKLTVIGSMLYLRQVSGTRVITTFENKNIDEYNFKKWGSHSNMDFIPYLTAAAALGVQKSEIDSFILKLKNVLSQVLQETSKVNKNT